MSESWGRRQILAVRDDEPSRLVLRAVDTAAVWQPASPSTGDTWLPSGWPQSDDCALGLRPGGRDVAARSERPRRRRGPLVACLYSIEQPKPVRPTRPAKWATPAEANTARRRYPECGRDAECVIPTSRGMCVPCAHPEEQRVT